GRRRRAGLPRDRPGGVWSRGGRCAGLVSGRGVLGRPPPPARGGGPVHGTVRPGGRAAADRPRRGMSHRSTQMNADPTTNRLDACLEPVLALSPNGAAFNSPGLTPRAIECRPVGAQNATSSYRWGTGGSFLFYSSAATALSVT